MLSSNAQVVEVALAPGAPHLGLGGRRAGTRGGHAHAAIVVLPLVPTERPVGNASCARRPSSFLA
jgi:hypothetical protein